MRSLMSKNVRNGFSGTVHDTSPSGDTVIPVAHSLNRYLTPPACDFTCTWYEYGFPFFAVAGGVLVTDKMSSPVEGGSILPFRTGRSFFGSGSVFGGSGGARSGLRSILYTCSLSAAGGTTTRTFARAIRNKR